jgi:hypothetical protein
MTFTHVFDTAGIGASPQSARDSNAFLRSQVEILLCVPAVGFAKTPAFFDDPFHAQSLASEEQIRN